MRRFPALLAVAAVAAGCLLSGCTAPSTGRPQDTVILGGLYESRPGAFEQTSANEIPVNTDKPTRNKRMSGDKVSILWGLITFRDQ